MYNIGFVQGVFDLFHIGHLNLIRRAKEKCKYLMVGVVVDSLPFTMRGKHPVVPFEERIKIIKAIQYVDEAVKVTSSNVNKKDLWRQYKFDCFFLGDDYIKNKFIQHERQWFRERGADMIFLPYTEGRTSTDIRKSLLT
jgi:glycerol-3-phosphate cytidylyltransferase